MEKSQLSMRPLYVPIVLGTTRQGRMSAHAARFVLEKTAKRDGVVTELIDVGEVPLPVQGAGEDIKEPGFADKMNRADALVLVTPEYNHSFPGWMKHVLDTCLEEYIHKAVGIVGVAAGPFGGSRMIQNLLAPLRELGLVTIFTDVYFGNVYKVFDENGGLLEPAFHRRTDEFLNELCWMATVLRYGREHVPSE